MAKFCFFTDPGKLAAQQPAQAFGPIPAADGNDRYRVTDLHSAAGSAPVVAICDGLLCAQQDAAGTLSLILKPIEQPPFDFPAIAYFIYKGVDPASLLAGAVVDVSKAADNDLVRQVQAAWLAPVNGNAGDPPRQCLGLHLTPASNAADFPDLDLSHYADAEPLDRLFYQGDAKFQLPLVRSGWRLGDFNAAGPFGLEIIADTAAYSPPIRLARRIENRIEVPSLDAGVTYEPYDAAYFMHWHAKEEALHFLDPCAFWGSFYHAKLWVMDAGGSKSRKKGAAIYTDVLRGPFDDSTPTAGLFFNRNKLYLDLRNEHHRSFNYYKTNGNEVFVTLDPDAAMEDCAQPYATGGWPIFTIDRGMLGVAPSGPSASLRLAFAANGFRSLSVNKPPNDLARAKRASARRQLDLALIPGAPNGEATFSFPLVGGGPHFPSSRYIRLAVLFDGRAAEADGSMPTGHDPWQPPIGIPIDGLDIAFAAPNSVSLKTYADTYILRLPFAASRPIAYHPAWIVVSGQAALALLPLDVEGTEVGAPAASHSAVLPGGDFILAVDRLIRPFAAVVRKATGGEDYFDFVAPARPARVPRARRSQALFFLSSQTVAEIKAARTPQVAALTLLPVLTTKEAPRFSLILQGVHSDQANMTPFIHHLSTAVASNVDAH